MSPSIFMRICFFCLLISIRAASGATLQGRVFVQNSTCPISQSTIQLISTKSSSQPVVVTATGTDGTFYAKVLDGDYYVQISIGTQPVYGHVVHISGNLKLDIPLQSVDNSYGATCGIAADGSNKVPSIAAQRPTVYQGKSWRPIDLSSDPSAGVVVLDEAGIVSKLVNDTNGIHLSALFKIGLARKAGWVAVNSDFVFVSTDSPIGCSIFRYSLATKSVDQKTVSAKAADDASGRCAGVAINGNMLYTLLPGNKEIRYWGSWDSDNYHSVQTKDVEGVTSLIFDGIGQRLLLTDGSGTIYSAQFSSQDKRLGKVTRLATKTGATGNAIVAMPDRIFLAAGKKIVALTRGDSHKEDAASIVQYTPNGHIVGLAVDSSNMLWIADDRGEISSLPVKR